ncbi:MAG TPA: Na+/H+ antiporter subunit E [Acidimicrobiales bacterium]|nr:Na+/H+ antiporter subunit E [Acidimicrobiales bacterium]
MNAIGSRRLAPRLQMTAWLVVVWVALWEDVSPANVIGGLFVASLLVSAFPLTSRALGGGFRPAAATRFLLYFGWKLVEASAVVSWEVVTPHNRINEGIVAVPIRGVSDTLTTLVANAISLTPGTLTLEIRRRPTILYVHVLHLQDIETVRREVARLELLAIRAFGSTRAISAAEADFRHQSKDQEKGQL